MKRTKFFATLCSTALLLAACDTSLEPNANQSNDHDVKNDTKEAVDLGLSVKWASCNVGATSETEYGNYYAWAETSTRSEYNWENYKYAFSRSELTKYGVDTLTTLLAVDDAATVNWGKEWRMPTREEWEELFDNCTRTWETKDKIRGYTLKSKKNGNSIFIPAAGYHHDQSGYSANHGYYWSSSLCESTPYGAYYVNFDSDFVNVEVYYRVYGYSIRPVQE